MRSAASRSHLRVALTLLLVLGVLACAASSASAAGPKPWGEFPALTPTKLKEEAASLSKPVPPKFAAAPNGAYYVLRETFVGKFILQRFEGKSLQAETPEFEPPPVKEKDEEAEAVNATLAVDPNGERVYVLFVFYRRGPDTSEENHEPEQFPLDSEMSAAGSLYAFKYESGKLVSAKTEGTKKVPAPALDREAMHSEAEEEHVSKKNEHPHELEPAERPLLDPRGMAVDPVTGDLAVTGNEDEAPMEKVQAGEEEKQCRAAVQFVSVQTGSEPEPLKLAVGARYVDKAGKVLFGHTGCGNAEEEEEGVNQAPASPVFAPDGTLLGYGEDEEVAPEEGEGLIWQLTPRGADESKAGEVLPMTPEELFVAESVPVFDPDVGQAEEPDSVMSLVPEGDSETDGTIYISGYHTLGDVQGQPTLLALHYSHPAGGKPSIGEVGWTAGGANEGLAPGPCDLHSTETEARIQIGGLAGSGRGLLAFTYYTENTEPKVHQAEVVEFGEGASTTGCPTVAPTTPTQTYRGEPTSELPAGQPLEVTSVPGTPGSPDLLAASPTSVAWAVKFTPTGGKTEELHFPETHFEYNGLQPEEPDYGEAVKLDLGTAARAGVYEISDVVHTDDLADEVAESGVDRLTVVPGKLEVKPEAPEPATVIAHEKPVLLKVEPKLEGVEGLDVTSVVWEFPTEGTKVDETAPRQLAEGEKLSVTHTFGRCGATKSTKCDVNVTVVANGETAKTQLQVTVQESKAEEEAETPPTETTPTSTTPTSTSTTPTTPASTTPTETTPKGGVQAYIASFAGSSLPVSTSGAASVTITCPSGGSCDGTLTLQTLTAVAASGKKGKKRVLTLASGAFSLAGGSKAVTLHLTSAGKTLLSRSRGVLRAKLTILSRGVGGQQNSTTSHVVTLRLVKPHKKSHKH